MADILDRTMKIAQLERSIAVREFTLAILHGDDEHRKWLMEASECFILGKTLPEPRGKGTANPGPHPAATTHAAIGE